jgi:hypothetical protein
MALGTLATQSGWARLSGTVSVDYFNSFGPQPVQTLTFQQNGNISSTLISFDDSGSQFSLTGDVIVNLVTNQINYSFHVDNMTRAGGLGFILDFSVPLDAPPSSNVMYSDITSNGTTGGDAFNTELYNSFLVTGSGSTSESQAHGLGNGGNCSIPAVDSNACDFTEVLDTLFAAPNTPLSAEVAFQVPVDSNGDANDFGVDGSIGFETPEPSSILLLAPALWFLRRRVV